MLRAQTESKEIKCPGCLNGKISIGNCNGQDIVIHLPKEYCQWFGNTAGEFIRAYIIRKLAQQN